MKKYLFIFLFVLISLAVTAQVDKKKVPNIPGFDEKKIHFGFLIGLNTMDFSVYHSAATTPENGNVPMYTDILNLQPGINIGIVSSLRLNRNLNLRFLPGISFGQRDLTYIQNSIVDEDTPLKIKSTFLEFPLLLKYSSKRLQNYRPYLIGGFNTRYDLSKDKQDKLVLNSLDFYWELGVGIDSYLNYFRLTSEFKISIGMRDILNHSGTGEDYELQYTQAIDKLTSRIFVFTFYFE